MKKFSKKKWAEFFSFLDDLRESGTTNMFGAVPYVMEAFDLDRDTASAVTGAWMRSFSRDKPPDVRAAKHLAAQ